MSKNKWHRALAALGLILNLVGTGCLALSFQATSSNFRLIAASNTNARGGSIPNGKAFAVCADQLELSAIDTSGNVFGGTGRCALWEKGSPAAIVVSDQPNLLWVGFGLLALGFFLQLILVFL